MELKTMVSLDSISRSGRHLQRYNKGSRQVVGCIPYRFGKVTQKNITLDGDFIEVLVISAKRQGKGMLFPKGGWENDESMVDAALRETMEEAGVDGDVERLLGKWITEGETKESYMFPLLVKQQLEFWPEKDIRQRKWVNVAEAMKVCQQDWMKEALELLVKRLTTQDNDEINKETYTLNQERRSNL